MHRSNRQHEAIAAAAARLLAEGSAGSMQSAKLKALSLLHLSPKSDVPDDEAVVNALRTHQLLFDPEAPRRLEHYRQVALSAMRSLSAFRPRLTGSLAQGWVVPESEIELELEADSLKDLELWLINHGVSYRSGGSMAEHDDLICAGWSPQVRLRVSHGHGPRKAGRRVKQTYLSTQEVEAQTSCNPSSGPCT